MGEEDFRPEDEHENEEEEIRAYSGWGDSQKKSVRVCYSCEHTPGSPSSLTLVWEIIANANAKQGIFAYFCQESAEGGGGCLLPCLHEERAEFLVEFGGKKVFVTDQDVLWQIVQQEKEVAARLRNMGYGALRAAQPMVRPSLRDLRRNGTLPTVETVGYFRGSLGDWGKAAGEK